MHDLPRLTVADTGGNVGGTCDDGGPIALSTPRQTENQTRRPEHAGVRVRVAAAVLDVVVMGLPFYLLLSVIFDFEGLSRMFIESRQNTEGLAAADAFSFSDFPWLVNSLTLILLAAITILLWVNWDGRTPGKKLMKVRIVSYPDYRPLSYGHAAVRTLFSLIASVTVVGYVVIALMVAYRHDKRGFHDIVAKTCVTHDQPS